MIVVRLFVLKSYINYMVFWLSQKFDSFIFKNNNAMKH
jgi:hypothetical protein